MTALMRATCAVWRASWTWFTSASVTTVFGTENLQTKYGGAQAAEVSSPSYYVKSEWTGGCGGCGTTGGVKRVYYYMDISHGTSPVANDVTRLVVEDTIDANGVGAFRTIYGLSNTGQQLRKATIVDPCGTPKFWCESWALCSETTYSYLLNCLSSHRTPAAHSGVTSSTIAAFLGEDFHADVPQSAKPIGDVLSPAH